MDIPAGYKLLTGTVKDPAGNPVTGTLVVTVTDDNNVPISPTTGSTAIAGCSQPIVIDSTGTLAGASVPDTTATDPQNIFLRLTIQDATGMKIWERTGIQTPGSSLDIGNLGTVPPLALAYPGPVGLTGSQGIPGPAGMTTATGANGGFAVPGVLAGTGLRNPWLSYDAFGDSITFGFNATTQAQAYAALFSTRMGFGSFTNHAISGSAIADQQDAIYAITVGATAKQLFTLAIGTNDQAEYGTYPTAEAHFQEFHQAALAWLAIPETCKTRGLAMTASSGWSASPRYGGALGSQSSTHGSTLTFSFTGSVLYLAYMIQDGNAGTFSVAVDGGPPLSFNEFSTAGVDNVTTGFGRNYGSALLRLAGFQSGLPHTVIITVTSATASGDVVDIHWAAGSEGIQSYAGPDVFALTVPRQNPAYAGAAPDTTIYAYNQMIIANASALQVDGAPVAWINDTAFLNPATDVGSSISGTPSDAKHLNNQGHQKRCNVMLAYVGAGDTILSKRNKAPSPTLTGIAGQLLAYIDALTAGASPVYTNGAGRAGINWNGFEQTFAVRDTDAAGVGMEMLAGAAANALALFLGSANKTGVPGFGITDGALSSAGQLLLQGLLGTILRSPAGQPIVIDFGTQLAFKLAGTYIGGFHDGAWYLSSPVSAPSYQVGTVQLITGAGVPSAAAPAGSMYLRTDGAAGSTFYVREGSAWTPK